MSYDANNRLNREHVAEAGSPDVVTSYAYDLAGNRIQKTVTGGPAPGVWTGTYNASNQLIRMVKTLNAVVVETVDFAYDDNGNLVSSSRRAGAGTAQMTRLRWNAWNQLMGVQLPDGRAWTYTYDYRMRRVGVGQDDVGGLAARHTGVVFSGGLSVAEFERTSNTTIGASTQPAVQFIRGTDMGGGVGGLHTLRNPVNTSGLPIAPAATRPVVLRYNLSNGRGDIVAQADAAGTLTWTASYEAYGKRTKETGQNADKQRANTKDEDPTGLLNEGFRYRDLETGVWLSRDPAGFVDGPNLYAYVKQNPWTMFDPKGLYQESGHFYTTYMVSVACGMSKTDAFQTAYYSQLPDEHNDYTAFEGIVPTGSKIVHRDGFLKRTQTSLHALHGKSETINHYTRKHVGGGDICDHRSGVAGVVSDKSLNTWERGLAIHALADSYAHTKKSRIGIYETVSAHSAPQGHLIDGYSPDIVSNRPELYAEYVNHLARSLSIVTGQKANREMIDKLVQRAAGMPPGGQSSKDEIRSFRDLAQADFGYDSNYQPENGHEERVPEMDSLNREKVGSLMDKLDSATTKKKKK
jgi:RHS repeat-associated protein